MLKPLTSGFKLVRKIPFSLFTGAVLTLILLFSDSSYSQLKDRSFTNLHKDKQFFYTDPLVFYSKDSSKARLDVYIEVPVENLQFKWNGSKKKYESAMDYDIIVTGPANEVVVRESSSNYISNSKQEHKQAAGKSEYIVKHFMLSPGKYDLSINLRDLNSKEEHSKNTPFSIADYTGHEVAVSDLMIVTNYQASDQGKKTITPLVNRNIGSLKDFYLFFEVYNNQDYLVKKDLVYKITDENKKEILRGKFDYLLEPGVNQKIEKFSTKDLLIGDYKMEILDGITSEVMAQKQFDFKWEDMPVSIQDIDLAINQAIYVAKTDEFDNMRNGKTPEEREKRFIKFWKDKDPSANTSKNELMIEYYARVQTANERYTNYFDGWKSDMGMIYIIYGDPSSIERYPFSQNSKPYEVWDYYEINRRFTFVDNTGFGDYRLTNPIWDQDRNKAY